MPTVMGTYVYMYGQYTTSSVDTKEFVYGAKTSAVLTIEEWFKVERRLVNSYAQSTKTYHKGGLRRTHFEDEIFYSKVV